MSKQSNILLLHGLTSNRKSLDEVSSFLETKGATCFAPPLLGHRHTIPRQDEVNFHNWELELQGYSKYLSYDDSSSKKADGFFIIAQSFGALLAITLANAEADKIKGMILLSPPIKFRSSLREHGISLLRILPASVCKALGSIKKSAISKSQFSDRDGEYYFNTLRHLAILRASALQKASKITIPVAIIHNAGDHHLLPESAISLAKSFSNSKLFLRNWGSCHNLLSNKDTYPVLAQALNFISDPLRLN